MGSISFAIDWHALPIAILLGILCYLVWKLKQRYLPPQIFVSELRSFNVSKNWRMRLAKLPTLLKYLSFILLVTAFIDPRIYVEQKKPIDPNPNNIATQGIALYLVLDQSGSMTETITTQSADGLPKRVSKIDLLKEMTSQFINGDPALGLTGRPNDLIGLVGFARTAKVLVPLTLDHRLVDEKLASFGVVKDKAEDGTAIGYAIYKTANLIATTRNFAKDLLGRGKPAYDIKNSVIMLVTDGMQDPNPADIGSRWRWIDPLEAAEFAKKNGVKLYIVNLEPSFNSAKYEANRSQMRKTAEITGGKFFILSNQVTLQDIYTEIDSLEKSSLPAELEMLTNLRKKLSRDELPNIYSRISFYPYLIALGLLCLALWAALETVVLRRLP